MFGSYARVSLWLIRFYLLVVGFLLAEFVFWSFERGLRVEVSILLFLGVMMSLTATV